jgi:hypothetical protein
MKFATHSYDPEGVSLDRLNPSAGYMKGNVAFCRFFVNAMKGNLSEKEFYDLMKRILYLRQPWSL